MTEELPRAWCRTRLVEIVDILDSQRVPVNNKERQKRLARATKAYPYYGATGQVGEIDDFIFDGGAVLLGEDGAPFLEPYKAKAYYVSGRYWVNNHAHILRGNGALDDVFLCHQLNVLDYRRYVSGTTRLKLTQASLKELPIKLPPINEQRRIVEKIETLFARLDKGEEALRAVQKLLARYRQSVLKAAVTGQLTADWRADNAHRLEHGRHLLARMLQTRREAWQGRGKYKEPAAPNTSGLPELPDGWVWVSLGALISQGPQNGLYLPQSKYGSGTPILRIDDYQLDWIRPRSDLRLVEAGSADRTTYSLRAGDFVVNRVNSVSHLGKSALVSEDYKGVLFESNMMRYSVSDQLSKEYLSLYLTSELGRKLLIKNCKHAVNQASINQGDVASTPVPLPSLVEQRHIADLVTEASSRETACKSWCETELARSSGLRQSILKGAFSGRVVPQDPADEPAADLLARIRKMRPDAPKKSRQKAMA